MLKSLLLCLCLAASSAEIFAQAAHEPTDQPTVPGPRFAKKTWADAHQANVARAKQGNVDLAFYGDSLTARWNWHPEVVKEKFGKYKTAIFGIGGDTTQDLLWRLQNGELDGVQPKVVVLLIGANNMDQKLKDTPEEIAKGVMADVAEIQKHAPDAKILVVGILTRNAPMDGWLNVKGAATNKLLKAMTDGKKNVVYIDLWKRFLKPDGTVDASLYDGLAHLNATGFASYADALLPFIGTYLQPSS